MTDIANYRDLSADMRYMGKSVSLRAYLSRVLKNRTGVEFTAGSGPGEETFVDRIVNAKSVDYEVEAKAEITYNKDDFAMLNQREAVQILRSNLIKRSILSIYITSYDLDIDLSDITMYERNLLENKLFMAYISGSFGGTALGDAMKAVEFSMLTTKSMNGKQMTVGDYVKYREGVYRTQLTEMIAQEAVRHREYWLRSVPGFDYKIYSTDLDEVQRCIDDEDCESGDIDDIEYLNIEILKRIKSTMKVSPVEEPKEVYVKTIVRVFQELVRAVRAIPYSFNGEKRYLDIDTNNCVIILNKLFFSCKSIFIPVTPVPDYLPDFFYEWDDFKDADVRIFWEFFTKLHVFFGSELGTVIKADWKNDKDVRDRINSAASDVFNQRGSDLRYTTAQNKRLEFMRGNIPVIMYTRDGCGYCDKAKKMLKDVNKKVVNNDIDDVGIPDDMRKLMGNHNTLPAIFYDGKFIGGADDLEKFLKTGLIPSSARR